MRKPKHLLSQCGRASKQTSHTASFTGCRMASQSSKTIIIDSVLLNQIFRVNNTLTQKIMDLLTCTVKFYDAAKIWLTDIQ